MHPRDLPAEYVERLNAVTAMRPRRVIQAILSNGSVNTDEIKDLGYDHPPRAAQDVRDLGIALTSYRVVGRAGRKIAAYEFADPATITGGALDGRKTFPKSLKTDMIELGGQRCAVCLARYEERYLQIDHRVPFQVGGDDGSLAPEDFQLLCGSDNRAKSWSCEHCPNWTARDADVCRTCYWHDTRSYEHVATRPERRATLVWAGEEVGAFDALAEATGFEDVEDYMKRRLEDTLEQ